eukprot:CAMPEP_0117609080 /NCGR_PEP_ID=MMETSP0784-20121206/81136_1 /TAXON_ID=39447 /ORGANISM="" /LENGTH=89 /DNA_ID=CAMNT_0005412367 /DNA_START=111 /DNA_END=378 /DNA_ORIENTATION=-
MRFAAEYRLIAVGPEVALVYGQVLRRVQKVGLHHALAFHLDLTAEGHGHTGRQMVLRLLAQLQLPREALLHHASSRVDGVAEQAEPRQL